MSVQVSMNQVRFDCRHFRGDIPCKPNKTNDQVCPTCTAYEPISKRILMIKLGAIGDVIRTTPLIQKFREVHPGCHITWLTLTPEAVPASRVDKIYKLDFKSVYNLSHLKFDIAINLDKDVEACALLADVWAVEKYGYILRDGHVDVANHLADHKFLTGMFDNLSKVNRKNYLEEIFEICGFSFNKEPYVLELNPSLDAMWDDLRARANGRKIIGLNTGCGDRWLTRLWPTPYWVDLITRLTNDGFFPVLLGGPAEDAGNRELQSLTGAYYPGTFTLPQFFSLTNQCDVIVTAVSMMMHIAIALRIPQVLFVNIFNPYEFELYDRGVIVQPDSGCDCYFGNTCKRDQHCMNDLPVEKVYQAVHQMLAVKKG
ncbi:MAG: glycosyltransferase family 9 protein [Bacteroidetes bacterium]|nr:glycosyltransferase family 9 protein [Bacteroidota bacterium]